MAREKAPPDVNDKAQRRVYVLPNELVERIGEFQKELGLGSEVEAVRRLLDGALKSRDSVERITARFVAQYNIVKSVRDAAKEVLVDHPLVTSIRFRDSELEFDIKDGHTVDFDSFEEVTIKDGQGDIYNFFGPTPEWASSAHGKKERSPFGRSSPMDRGSKNTGSMSNAIDDDIPF